jgi:hypothetical protein
MSLGLGIFLSTILLISAWQIDKRNAWARAGKVSLGLLGAAVIVSAAAYGYFGWWADLKTKRAHEAEIAEIRNPTGLKYWGITLGVSKPEVRYLKGDPTEIEATNKEKGTQERWIYKLGDGPSEYFYDMYWDDENTHLVAITCQGRDTTNCERVMGIGPGATEAAARSALGKPDEDNPPNDKGMKSLSYGTGKDKLLIFLSHGKVDVTILTRKP